MKDAKSIKEELIDEIAHLQMRFSHGFRHLPGPWLSLDLTLAQLKSLFIIHYEESINSRKLASALGVTPPNVTGIIDRLVEQGMVIREENPQDRRELLLKTTEKGRNLYDSLHEAGPSRMVSILAGMSESDLACLARGLRSLVKAAEQYRGEVKI